jgi:hypothetical protein
MLGCGLRPHPSIGRIPAVFTGIFSRLLEVQPESPFRTKALGWHLSKRLGQGSSAGPDGPVRARNAHFAPQGPGGRGFRPDL